MTDRNQARTTGGAAHTAGERGGLVGELVVRIYDRGPEPEWHRDRRLFGPWHRFEARVVGRQDGVSEVGWSPWEAAYRLIAGHREIALTTHAQREQTR